jgi:hypothetical protein
MGGHERDNRGTTVLFAPPERAQPDPRLRAKALS